MPNLYVLLRGLAGLYTAERDTILFNAPDCSGTSATFGNKTLTLTQLKGMQLELVGQIEKDMDELLFGSSLFSIQYGIEIHDEPRTRLPGYCFVDDKRNAWTSGLTLIRYILENPDIFKEYAYVDHTGKVRWLPGACTNAMAKIIEIQQKLFVATMLTSGMPARGTELACALLRNVAGGSIRNAFVLFDIFQTRGSYNKTSDTTGADKMMTRIPLPALGRLWVRFLVFLKPAFAEWQFHLRPEMYFNAKYFLLSGLNRSLTSHDLSVVLARHTDAMMGVRLTLSVYRQFVSFIVSQNDEMFRALGVDTETATHEQLGHTKATGDVNYGHDAALPAGMSMEVFRRTARVSAFWQALCGHEDLELLRKLEEGRSRQKHLMDRIRAVVDPVPLRVSDREFTDRRDPDAVRRLAENLSFHVLPGLVERVQESVAQSLAVTVHMFSNKAVSVHSDGLQQIARVLTHPALLVKLRNLLSDHGQDLGFRSGQQAQVAQYLFGRKEHVAVIAGTGTPRFLPACTGRVSLYDIYRKRKKLSTVTLYEIFRQRSQHCLRIAPCVDARAVPDALPSIRFDL